MKKECKFIEVQNNLGTWTFPKQFAPYQVGGDHFEVAGVIGHTAVGEKHSEHIIKAMLLAVDLKRDTVSSQDNTALFIDAGAHIGTITVSVAKELENFPIRSKYYSVELLPEIYHCLQRNIINNNVGGEFITVNAALTSNEIEERVGLMNVPSLCEGWNFDTQPSTAGCFTYSEKDLDIKSNKVATTTIDKLLKDETLFVTALKVDCEGSDLDVLKGGVKTIERSRPVILFEDTDRSQTVFLVDKEKTKREKTKNNNGVFVRCQNMLNDEISSFFKELDYKVVRNFMYTSWNEFIAIPNEHIGEISAVVPQLYDYLPADNHATWFRNLQPDLTEIDNFRSGLFSIFEAWGEARTKLWLTNKGLHNHADLNSYMEKLIKC